MVSNAKLQHKCCVVCRPKRKAKPVAHRKATKINEKGEALDGSCRTIECLDTKLDTMIREVKSRRFSSRAQNVQFIRELPEIPSGVPKPISLTDPYRPQQKQALEARVMMVGELKDVLKKRREMMEAKLSA